MEIKDLNPNSKVINLVASIDVLEEPWETPNGKKVQEGVISDKTGQMKISFWEDEIGMFKVGDKIVMVTGWCKEFTPKDAEPIKKISSGKFGKIRVVPPEKVGG